VGRPVVQQFKGVIEEQKAYRGYILTTSRFTDEAKSSAQQNDRIRLIDWEELMVWHEKGRVEV
jgi:restriction endonuclease Mrr